jgi:hypothetical protein
VDCADVLAWLDWRQGKSGGLISPVSKARAIPIRSPRTSVWSGKSFRVLVTEPHSTASTMSLYAFQGTFCAKLLQIAASPSLPRSATRSVRSHRSEVKRRGDRRRPFDAHVGARSNSRPLPLNGLICRDGDLTLAKRAAP